MAFGIDPTPETCDRNKGLCGRIAVARIFIQHGAGCGARCCGDSVKEARTDTEIRLLCQSHEDVWVRMVEAGNNPYNATYVRI